MEENLTLEEIMLDHKIWAVVGATQDPKKFGNKIYKRLKSKGYETYAVNPGIETIEGNYCYKDLASVPRVPEVINMVVRPHLAKDVLFEAQRLGIEYVWFQPGTYNDEIIKITEELGLKFVKACVLVETRDK